MTTSNVALGIIAYLRGCDKEGARSFCEDVQGYCAQEPSFADIGEAIRLLDDNAYDARDVAEKASELRGWADNVIEEEVMDDEVPSPDSHNEFEQIIGALLVEQFDSIRIDFEPVDRATRLHRDIYLHAVAIGVCKQLFATAIDGLTIGVTGDGPFDAGNLEKFITKLGATVDHSEIPWGEQDYFVIGRTNYDTSYLEESLDNAPGIQYFSQEDFFNFLLFGVEPGYFPGDTRIAAHPGLTFLSSASADEFQWPEVDLTVIEIIGDEIDASGWQEEHRLRSEFGYNVSKQEGLSERQRRDRLGRAVQEPPRGLGLYQVAYHIAGLIRLNKNRRNRESAVSKWQSDLDWLYKNYYEGRATSYRWPGWDI